MKRHGWIATIGVTVFALIIAAPAMVSTATDLLETRVSVLETRVNDLEATITAMSVSDASTETQAGSLTATIEINIVGDGWESVGSRNCKTTHSKLKDIREGAEIKVIDESDQPVGTGVFGAGTRVNQGCIFRAELTLDPADYYYVSIGLWDRFEFTRHYLETHEWTITLTAA